MAKNSGKVFETNFKNSVPEYVLLCRLSDSAQSYGGSSAIRFTLRNPFDFILWDSKNKRLFALELKTVGEKSISFEREKTESRTIHKHQIDGLLSWGKYDGVTAGFIIEFRKFCKTIFIDINEFCRLTESISKCSFNLDDLEEYGIKHHIIGQRLKKVNYAYDVDDFLNKLNLEE